MFDAINTEERGQVGIGTLIIFIAMVLVAAVAAGVLINTAGLLESSASDTAEDSQAQVSNQITVVSAVGDVNSGDVETLDFTIMKSAGADDIDLADATVKYTSSDVSKTLTFIDGAAPNDTRFAVYNIDATASGADELGAGNVVLDDQSTRKVIRIDLTAVGDVLAEGEDATVRFVDQSGASTIYGVNVPDTISDENSVAV